MSDGGGVFPAVALVAGRASGPVLVLAEPLSFWGGLDAATGLVVDRWHPQRGACLTGVVLLMEAGRGSSSGSSVLAEALRRGTGPAALVTLSRDAIAATGAMVAAELYGLAAPVVLARREDWAALGAARRLEVAAEDGGDARATLRALP